MAIITPTICRLRRQLAKKAGTFRWLTREPEAIRRKNLMISGRSGRIRTCDPCVPNAVLYRAEPHSDKRRRLIASGAAHRKHPI